MINGDENGACACEYVYGQLQPEQGQVEEQVEEQERPRAPLARVLEKKEDNP
jgi:hypothetical protein